MRVPPLRFLTRVIILLAVVLLIMTAASALFGLRIAQAETNLPQDQATSYPIYTDTPSPIETYINGVYPVDTETPAATNTVVVNTPVASLTFTATSTLAPNQFLTENSEIGTGNVTPAADLTPGPTITAYSTLTPSQTPAAAVTNPKKNSAPWMDWGLFWIGFAIPVLAGCGGVLYLLDRRSDLFRARPKQ